MEAAVERAKSTASTLKTLLQVLASAPPKADPSSVIEANVNQARLSYWGINFLWTLWVLLFNRGLPTSSNISHLNLSRLSLSFTSLVSRLSRLSSLPLCLSASLSSLVSSMNSLLFSVLSLFFTDHHIMSGVIRPLLSSQAGAATWASTSTSRGP